jgi:hypothetical protein
MPAVHFVLALPAVLAVHGLVVAPGALGVLAAPVVDEETVTPGPLGFAVVLFLAIATWLLVRSMNHHLRKVPRDVPRDPEDQARQPDPRQDEEG